MYPHLYQNMCKLRLCYFIFYLTNILRCYGEDVIVTQAVHEVGTEDESVIGDDNLNNTDIWDYSKHDMKNETLNDDDMKEKTENKMEGRVVGGGLATITNYPHSVFLSVDCGTTFSCGSSVLNQRILLTAAHCVVDCKTVKNYAIDAAAGNTNVLESTIIKQIKKYVIHTDYDDELAFCDIALLQLNGNLPLSKTIQRVIIRPTFPKNAEAMVAGWGMTHEEDDGSTVTLKHVKQKVWNLSACNKVEKMLKGHICASSGSSKDYPYQGDSGSALITKNFQEIGLVSYKGNKVVELIYYTNVSYFYPWIVKISRLLRCE